MARETPLAEHCTHMPTASNEPGWPRLTQLPAAGSRPPHRRHFPLPAVCNLARLAQISSPASSHSPYEPPSRKIAHCLLPVSPRAEFHLLSSSLRHSIARPEERETFLETFLSLSPLPLLPYRPGALNSTPYTSCRPPPLHSERNKAEERDLTNLSVTAAAPDL